MVCLPFNPTEVQQMTVELYDALASYDHNYETIKRYW